MIRTGLSCFCQSLSLNNGFTAIGGRVWGLWKVHLSSGAGRHRPSHPRTSHWHKPSPEKNLSAHGSLFHCSAWFLSKHWKQKKEREVFSYRQKKEREVFTYRWSGSFALVSLHIWAHLRHLKRFYSPLECPSLFHVLNPDHCFYKNRCCFAFNDFMSFGGQKNIVNTDFSHAFWSVFYTKLSFSRFRI